VGYEENPVEEVMKKSIILLMVLMFAACATAPERASREERSKPITSALTPAPEIPAEAASEETPELNADADKDLGSNTQETEAEPIAEAQEAETPEPQVSEPSREPVREPLAEPVPVPKPEPTPPVAEEPRRETPPAAANDTVKLRGEFIYVEGDVYVSSKGKSYDVFEGDPIEPYETLETGPDSFAELEITGPGLGSAVIKFSPNTSFYFEGSYESNSSETLLQLMSGQMRVAVKNLGPDSRLDTYTRVSVLGVRGTIYNVVISPGENVLVTCEEGLVSYDRQDGSSQEVYPGQAILSNVQEPPRPIPLSPDQIPAYTETWINDVEKEKLIANAPALARTYKRRFMDQKVAFERSYVLLRQNFEILEQWAAIIESGRTLSMAQTITERKVLAPILLNLRKSTFFLERDIAQIEVFYRAVGKTPQANVLVSGGSNVQEYLAEIGDPLLQIKRQLSMVRWAYRVFADIDPGSPLGDFLNTDFSGGEEEFFEDTSDYFD
jgi:hypothetical protein